MTEGLFIAGEWGSAVMRLYLCDADGQVVADPVSGGGVVGCGDFEAAFFSAAGPWLDRHGPLPAVLAGMIGSNIGWRDSGYVEAPAGPADIAARLTTLRVRNVDIRFTPGLTCRNPFGLPDLIRGEEMQALGWLASQNDAGQGLICLPGRHTKWLLSEAGRITAFTTAMHGEMYDLMLAHGLLGKGVDRDAWSDEAFDAGLDLVCRDSSLSHGHAAFATRGRLVLGQHNAAEAAAFLSGVTIGCDVRDMRSALEARELGGRACVVLGHDVTAGRYGRALERLGASWKKPETPHLAARGLAAVLRAATATTVSAG